MRFCDLKGSLPTHIRGRLASLQRACNQSKAIKSNVNRGIEASIEATALMTGYLAAFGAYRAWLSEDMYDLWLSPDQLDTAVFNELLIPTLRAELLATPINKASSKQPIGDPKTMLCESVEIDMGG